MPQLAHPGADGTHYPTDHVLGVLASQEAALAATAALVATGFAWEDVVAYHGQEGLRQIQARETLRSRLGNLLDRLSEENGLGRAVYMDALRAGHSLLMIYAPDDDAIERARIVLHTHGAQKLVVLRRLSVETL